MGLCNELAGNYCEKNAGCAEAFSDQGEVGKWEV